MSDPAPSKLLADGTVLADALVCELLEARLIGVLATSDPVRSIHAVPMWFALDEDCVLLATGSQSRKVRNLELDPRATLVVHDSRPGFECAATRSRDMWRSCATLRRAVSSIAFTSGTSLMARTRTQPYGISSSPMALRCVCGP